MFPARRVRVCFLFSGRILSAEPISLHSVSPPPSFCPPCLRVRVRVLARYRNELLAERHEKAKIHQTIQKHLSDKQKLQFALKSLKVEMLETKSRVAETEGKNSSLEHELHTSTQAHEQDKQMMLAKYENHIEQSSQFQHTLQTRVRELEKRLLEQKQNHALAEQKESNCHSNEMDRLHQRVKVVMEKKEAQVRALQDKIKNVESRLATTQRMMMAQQEELASI